MQDPTDEAEPRPFADWLREQRNGVSHSTELPVFFGTPRT